MAKVSVIIPVYNIAAHLRRCLDSVAGQTVTDIEIICVDDGSTDESPKILAEFAERDRRFMLLTQANAGPGAARNLGLDRASGEYLIFLDSDDWFEADFLELMMRQAKETDAEITICRSVEFDTETMEEYPSEWMLKTELLPGEVFRPQEAAEALFQFTYGWPWDKLYKTEFIHKHALRYPILPNSEDLVFVFQSLTLAETIAVLPKVLVHHRVNRLSSVSNSRKNAPEIPHTALALLYQSLAERGLYEVYEQSFCNWAMEFLIWNVANMGDSKAQKTYFYKLKREWLPEMDFERHPGSYYRHKFQYLKYLLVKYAPYPVFAAVTAIYKCIKQIWGASVKRQSKEIMNVRSSEAG